MGALHQPLRGNRPKGAAHVHGAKWALWPRGPRPMSGRDRAWCQPMSVTVKAGYGHAPCHWVYEGSLLSSMGAYQCGWLQCWRIRGV